MNVKVAKVLNGFLKLNNQEKKELLEEIQVFFKDPSATERILQESLKGANAITFGPAPSSCPCCGK